MNTCSYLTRAQPDKEQKKNLVQNVFLVEVTKNCKLQQPQLCPDPEPPSAACRLGPACMAGHSGHGLHLLERSLITLHPKQTVVRKGFECKLLVCLFVCLFVNFIKAILGSEWTLEGRSSDGGIRVTSASHSYGVGSPKILLFSP